MKLVKHLAAVAGAVLLAANVAAAEPVKVGIIAPFSGPFSNFGEAWKAGIRPIEDSRQIRRRPGDRTDLRDLTGPNPSEAKALAQELVIKDKVRYLGGVVFTPNAFAIAPVVEEAKIPTVIFNAATSSVLEKSKYLVRTSYTLPQITVPIACFALEQGVKSVVTMVSDYGPASMRKPPSSRRSRPAAARSSKRSASPSRPPTSRRSCRG